MKQKEVSEKVIKAFDIFRHVLRVAKANKFEVVLNLKFKDIVYNLKLNELLADADISITETKTFTYNRKEPILMRNLEPIVGSEIYRYHQEHGTSSIHCSICGIELEKRHCDKCNSGEVIIIGEKNKSE